MKKKNGIEPEQIKGWTFITNIRANCGACGGYMGLEDPVYWKRDKDRSVIRCKGCAREAAKA
jgi:hypothetical protein